MREKIINNWMVVGLIFVALCLLCVMRVYAGEPSSIQDLDGLEVTIYGMNSGCEDYISIPDSYPTTSNGWT